MLDSLPHPPYQPLILTSVSVDHAIVLKLTGDLDCCGAPILCEALDTLTGSGIVHLVLDLAGLSFCDAAGLGALIGCRRRIQEHGGRLGLADVPATITNLFRMTGLTGVFDIVSKPVQAAADPRTPALIGMAIGSPPRTHAASPAG